MSAVPNKPGFYWAKWMLVDDKLEHFQHLTPHKSWEVVEVYLRDFAGEDSDYPDELRVWMIGHEFSQALDCFHWGAKLDPPVDKTMALRDDTRERERKAAIARYQQMTLAERIEHASRRKI